MPRTERRSLRGKVETDAEHEEDDADLGEVPSQILVGDKARGERAHQHTGDEIAHERRDPYPVRQRPKDKGEDEASHNGGD